MSVYTVRQRQRQNDFIIESPSGADPGFPLGGGTNPPGGGVPTYDFANF